MIEINKAIEKDLPNQVGENLRKMLEQGKQDAEKVIQLNRVNLNQSETITRHEETIKEYQKLDARNAELEAREKAVKDKEIQQKIDELTYQLAAEKDKTTFSQNVAMGLVRNTEYRKAIFKTVMSLAFPDGKIFNVEGECKGFILEDMHGVEGFGYDPLFWVPTHGCASAQLPSEVKQRISHRGLAMASLLAQLS
jgi:non-canonical purine NTP pyrophosphatase (RdgB/HAM1 family)